MSDLAANAGAATAAPIQESEVLASLPDAWAARHAKGLVAATKANMAVALFVVAFSVVWRAINGSLDHPVTLLLLPLALLHVLLFIPFVASRAARRALDALNGRGDAEGHHLHLLAVPDQPRPLYFWMARASIRRTLTWTAWAAMGAAWSYWIALLFLTVATLHPLVLLPLALPPLLLGWVGLGVAQGMARAVAATTGRLGGLSTVAASRAATAEWVERANDAFDLDEHWGMGQAESWLAYAKHQAIRAALIFFSLAAYFALALPILLAPIAVGVYVDQLLGGGVYGARALSGLLGLAVGMVLLALFHVRAAKLSRRIYSPETRERYELVLPE